MSYLGHIISNGSLRADPYKLAAMTAWPTPSTAKQLHSFLRLTGYYCRFVSNYSHIDAHLTDLLKSDTFHWSNAATQAFTTLKVALTSTLVLCLLDFSQPFIVETDASGTGIGAVLLQNDHHITFFSKKLGARLLSASIYHRELWAIVEALQKWRQYLLGCQFTIPTYQRSLRELLHQIIQTLDQHSYVRKLMGYKFTIEYKQGSSNRVCSFPPRRCQCNQSSLGHLLPAASITPHHTASRDPNLTDLFHHHELSAQGYLRPTLSVHDGLVFL